MEKAPDIVPIYIHLGIVQTLMGELDRAIETYHKGLDLDPDNLTLIAGISDTLERQGKFEQAYQILEPYLDDDSDGIAQVASMYAKLSNRFNTGGTGPQPRRENARQRRCYARERHGSAFPRR